MMNIKKIPKWIKTSSIVLVCVASLGIGCFLGVKEYTKYNQTSKNRIVSEIENKQVDKKTSKYTSEPLRQENKKIIFVYKTKSGRKYHKEGCLYLNKSKIRLTLEEAKNKGLEPCKYCFNK